MCDFGAWVDGLVSRSRTGSESGASAEGLRVPVLGLHASSSKRRVAHREAGILWSDWPAQSCTNIPFAYSTAHNGVRGERVFREE
jgi:hypothetical protein